MWGVLQIVEWLNNFIKTLLTRAVFHPNPTVYEIRPVRPWAGASLSPSRLRNLRQRNTIRPSLNYRERNVQLKIYDSSRWVSLTSLNCKFFRDTNLHIMGQKNTFLPLCQFCAPFLLPQFYFQTALRAADSVCSNRRATNTQNPQEILFCKILGTRQIYLQFFFINYLIKSIFRILIPMIETYISTESLSSILSNDVFNLLIR